MERITTDTRKSLEFYELRYESLAKVALLPKEKKFIGNREKRKCRYCCRSAPAVSFRMVAHAFPQFIGNRTLFAYDECDDCNRRFSKSAEQHFARYLGLERTTSKIRGKKGVPTYKDAGRQAEVRFDGAAKKLRGQAHVDDGFFFLDTDQRRLTLRWRRQPYIPREAFSCLVKMALAIVPEDRLHEFTGSMRWLIGERRDASVGGCFQCFRSLSVTGVELIEAILLTRKDDQQLVPYASFLVIFANFGFQIFLPGLPQDSHLIGKNFGVVPFPNKLEHLSKVFYFKEDLSSEDLLKDDIAETNFEYDGPISVTKVAENSKPGKDGYRRPRTDGRG